MKIDYWQKFEEGNWYHVYNRGINSCNIFRKDDNYRFFLWKFNKYLSPYFSLGAYCLLPNHFHFLVKVKPLNERILAAIKKEQTNKSRLFLEGDISYNTFLESQVKRFFSSYSLAFNKQEKRTGSLFQKRFKRLKVSNESRLLYVLGYIHHNPIHHGLSQHFSGWRYSSYNDFLSNFPDLIEPQEIMELFSYNDKLDPVSRFVEYHRYFKLTK